MDSTNVCQLNGRKYGGDFKENSNLEVCGYLMWMVRGEEAGFGLTHTAMAFICSVTDTTPRECPLTGLHSVGWQGSCPKSSSSTNDVSQNATASQNATDSYIDPLIQD